MRTVLQSARFYFWPVIVANVLATTAGAGGDFRRMAAFSAVIATISSFGFLVNDLCDRAIDRVNHAGHFESSPRHTLALGWCAAGVFATVGLLIAWQLGSLAFLIALGSAVCLGLYSPLLRRALILPNVATAWFATGPLWTPLALTPGGGARWQWWLALGVFLMLTGREILMDVRDRSGDAIGGRPTLATVAGARLAVRTAVGLTIAAFVPFVTGVLVASTHVTPGAIACGVILTSAIAVLMLGPALRLPVDTRLDAAIQAYVRSSRLAMAVLPALLWVLAASS
ncbi:MAG: UbiA family prenyltransferase [Acidobacteriota bacterium]